MKILKITDHDQCKSGTDSQSENLDSNSEHSDAPSDLDVILAAIEVAEHDQNNRRPYYPIMDEQVPGVEFVYPEGDIGLESHPDFLRQNVRVVGDDQSSAGSSEYVVDPAQTTVMLTVDGEVVVSKRCFLKMCGFVICDDEFPYTVNPQMCPILIGLFIVVVAIIGGFAAMPSVSSASTISGTNVSDSIILTDSPIHSIIPSLSPSNMPTYELTDLRVRNITEVLFEITGEMLSEQNSAQNKALTWITEEDSMNLTFSSPNLLQRYTLMVIYYSLAGDQWFEKDGFGSNAHECGWFGVTCKNGILEIINLKHNNLQGSLPKEIGRLTRIRVLMLGSNQIAGSIPTQMGTLTRMQRLNIDENMISGTIPHELGNCINLQYIDLGSNQLNGSIPSSMANIASLQFLRIHRNKLGGTIPSDLSRLPNIRQIWCFQNKLTGSIPLELGSITSLEDLELDSNKLIGTVPSSFVNLVNMEFLWLNDNQLTGTIPSDLSGYTKLILFRLDNNMLSGIIPESIELLLEAEHISLHDNALNGTIPSNIGKLNKLDNLELHHNILTGSIPDEVCKLRIEKVTADCASNTAGVVCSCCTICY